MKLLARYLLIIKRADNRVAPNKNEIINKIIKTKLWEK